MEFMGDKPNSVFQSRGGHTPGSPCSGSQVSGLLTGHPKLLVCSSLALPPTAVNSHSAVLLGIAPSPLARSSCSHPGTKAEAPQEPPWLLQQQLCPWMCSAGSVALGGVPMATCWEHARER